jgi:hypothetical protein
VHAAGNDAGPFVLEITSSGPPEVANDFCENAEALVIAADAPVISTTSSATLDENAPACGEAGVPTSPGTWYTIEGTGVDLIASTCFGSDFDTKVSIYLGAAQGPGGACDALICVDGNDDRCNLQSEVQWFAADGVTYHVLVSEVSCI